MIEELNDKWRLAAERGDNAACYSIEQEIDALKRQGKREAVQREAERKAADISKAISAAEATRKEIEAHRIAREEMEKIVVELETAAAAIDDIFKRIEPAWTKCRVSFPRFVEFEDGDQQAAYHEALKGDRYPRFAPLRLPLRLPNAMTQIRHNVNGGLNHVLQSADARF